jgi:cell division protease FtsH
MKLTVTEDSSKKESVVRYTVPNVNLFYNDVSDYIKSYNEEHPNNRMTQDVIRPAETSWLVSLIPTLLMIALLVAFWVFMMKRMGGGGAGNQMNFGKAKVKQINDEKRRTTFADVAGADEEKEELREIVEFLKRPNKYNELGARIPKGVLLVGPPGTGKTLAGARRCRRGRRAVLLHLRFRLRGDVRRRRCIACARPVRQSEEKPPLHHLHR